ncbi:GPI inositol-deacylase isoform X2 [Hippocampus comes]|uniref:GPI inositol-deacylase isoform X2 n=1 Tax=Hippocampus comes TaxID=109280 RepID=UPI00094E1559|nr:PREDICTED: GPI inositol-deacylase isoform X2 [Hippocampus comes]
MTTDTRALTRGDCSRKWGRTMKLATLLFYGFALGLVAVGLREVLTGFEEDRCSMTYMFQYPEFRRVPLPHRVARRYPAYGLYLYGEGAYAQETRELQLFGAPVIFLHGNSGSYKQVRSLGSVALRKAESAQGGLHFNVFTVDFNEELVALYGGSLRRQTLFLHESIKAILKLYKHLKTPPQSVVLVGHSMGGLVARALFTLPNFNASLVRLIITQATPHLAPVLVLDHYLRDFYLSLRKKWVQQADELRNVTVLSIGGGHRDYQVRSGLISIPCSPGDPTKLSLVATAVPRTWVSTDHLSIVWCKELVLTTVRAFFDLIDPETRQFTDNQAKKSAVLNHHFVRHPARMLGDTQEASFPIQDAPEAWSEVNSLRLAYRAPKEVEVKYFTFALSSRRKADSHFYCRSNNLDMTSWVYGCVRQNGSSCRNVSFHSVHTVDLSNGTELLPLYKVLTLSLSDLSSFTHVVVSAPNVSGKQFTLECEWQRQQSVALSLPVPHVLSLGLTVSEVTVSSSGLFHTIELKHFHEVYQAFRIHIASECKARKVGRSPSVFRMKVPWFFEDVFTTASVPSVAEISGMLHTNRPDNVSSVVLQLHTSPNCQYKVSVRLSLPKMLGQILRFFLPMVPVYTTVTLLLACGGQLSNICKTQRAASMSLVLYKGLQPHKVNLCVYILHILFSWLKSTWSLLCLPMMDVAPPIFPDVALDDDTTPCAEWPYLLHPLLYVIGAGVAFWGTVLLRLGVRLVSLILAVLHRSSISRDCGTLRLRTQLLITIFLTILGWKTCGAVPVMAAFALHLYRVLRLQMAERSLRHILNLAPQKHRKHSITEARECNSAPLLSECALWEVKDDLQLHLCLSALLTIPVILSAPSLVYWSRNLGYSTQLDPDPYWPYFVPLCVVYLRLINCNTQKLTNSKLLHPTSFLPLPVSVAMVIFCPMHLYRVTYFLLGALVPLALCCVL